MHRQRARQWPGGSYARPCLLGLCAKPGHLEKYLLLAQEPMNIDVLASARVVEAARPQQAR